MEETEYPLMTARKIHFVTGRLAEQALRREIERIAPAAGFVATVQVLPISVAALMTGEWIARRIEIPEGTDEVLVPGYCDRGLEVLREAVRVPVRAGPRDLRDLGRFFGQERNRDGFGPYDIEIIAEINHAPRLAPESLTSMARALAADGADVIDVGCDPGGGWSGAGDAVRRLRDAGFRVSIDSFDPAEVAAAVAAGAELVLSVNSSNVAAASEWGCEVVVVPDHPDQWERAEETFLRLERAGIPWRFDPVLEPAGIGLVRSLARYVAARDRWPEAPMMMGIGNVTELADADSAAINLLLLTICEELAVRSILTTQVIHWCRSAVRECSIARRIAWYAVREQVPIKRISDELLVVRGEQPPVWDERWLAELAGMVRDRNYRIFAGGEDLAVCGDGMLWRNRDPFALFDQMLESQRESMSVEHAFYLGFELAKAGLARQLGKRYEQDEGLHWGFLTEEEPDRHRLKRRGRQGLPMPPGNDGETA